MVSLRVYRIEDKYIRFLKGVDSRVQDNKDRHRPYVGVVLLVGEYKYFVPMESPKPNHAHMSPGRHIMPIDHGNYGILGFNNMIPVPDCALIYFNIDDEPDEKYANLLRRQISFINRHKAEVYERAQNTYRTVVRGGNAFLSRISCDFRKLERASENYNPNYQRPKTAI